MVRQRPAKPCTRVRFPSPPRAISSAGERFPDTEEVTGSIPVSRTTVSPGQRHFLRKLGGCLSCFSVPEHPLNTHEGEQLTRVSNCGEPTYAQTGVGHEPNRESVRDGATVGMLGAPSLSCSTASSAARSRPARLGSSASCKGSPRRRRAAQPRRARDCAFFFLDLRQLDVAGRVRASRPSRTARCSTPARTW